MKKIIIIIAIIIVIIAIIVIILGRSFFSVKKISFIDIRISI